jgi:fatty acid synthase subunit beta
MKNWTEKTVHVDMPVVDFVRGPSSDQLAKSILVKYYDKFGKPSGESSGNSSSSESDVTSANVSDDKGVISSKASLIPYSSSTPVVEEVKEKDVEKKQSPPTAFLFTGQSALKVGVGMDLYEQYPQAKEIWDICDQHFLSELGISLLKIIRENPKEYKIDFANGSTGAKLREKYMNFVLTRDENIMKQVGDPSISPKAFPMVDETTESYTFRSPNGLLHMTHFAQPIIIIYEYVALSVLTHNNKNEDDDSTLSKSFISSTSIFCGHSLGEYCALVSIGHIVFFFFFIYVIYFYDFIFFFAIKASAHDMAMTCFMRGMVMQTCVERDPITQVTAYRMAAISPSRVGNFFSIHNLNRVIESVITAAGGRLLQIVNYNVYNDQYIVSGERYTIWLLSDVLTYIHDNGEATLKDIDVFCYKSIAKHPYSATPFDIPKSVAVIQLAGIDIPFHSKVLRKVVPLFRSFLDSRLPPSDQFSYTNHLVNRYITNIYSKQTFEVSLPYARKLLSITNSPFLAEVLGILSNPDVSELDMDNNSNNPFSSPSSLSSTSSSSSSSSSIPWLLLSENERARLLIREALSYQFASPVQWIDTQNLIASLGSKRVVEIGPSKVFFFFFWNLNLTLNYLY